jgi:hypothetical protein
MQQYAAVQRQAQRRRINAAHAPHARVRERFLYDFKGGSPRSPPAGCGRPQAAVLAGRSTPRLRPDHGDSGLAVRTPPVPEPARPQRQALVAGAYRLRATPVVSAAAATAAATAGATARLNTLGTM